MILAVIQARMNSTRLPGKVLLPIQGKPVISHIHERIKNSAKVDKICISTSTNKIDDTIVEFAESNNILCFRGSEKNLISRHLGAAQFFNADAIIRITSDNPLVDPQIIDEIISVYEKNPFVDFVCNNKERTYPIGLDVELIPTKTLEKFLEKSNDYVFYEYFIGGYIFEHPEEFTSIGISIEPSRLYRWTLDYSEDYEFMKKIYSYLYDSKGIFNMNDIFNLLESHPELVEINKMHMDKFSHLKRIQEK